MSELKRCEWDYGSMSYHPEGDYVLYDDAHALIENLSLQVADLKIERDELQRLFNAAAEDQVRLEFLILKCASISSAPPGFWVRFPETIQVGFFPTARAAIDAAMAADVVHQLGGEV